MGSIKKNFIYNLLYQILLIVLPLVTSPYVTRILGADALGIYSYTQAIANYFVLFIMLGVSNYGNRTIAELRDNKEKMSQAFIEIYCFQLVMAFLLSLIYIGYCFVVVRENFIIYILQFIYVLSAAFDVSWLFFGLEKFKETVIRSTIVKVLNVICIFVFVKSADDLWIYTLIMCIGIIMNQLTLWPILIKKHYVKLHYPTFKGIVKHIKPNLVLFIPVVAVSLYNIMDKIMLGGISSKAEVGFYTYAERIVQIPITLSTALGTVMMPRMSNLSTKNKTADSIQLFDKAMQFSIITSMAFTFGLLSISQTLIPWFYGDEFGRCSYFTMALCPIIAIKAWAHVIRTQYIIPQKMDNVYIISVFSGAGINLILNLMLIRYIAGIGAIIATVCAELLVCVIQFVFVRKKLPLKKYIIDAGSYFLIGLFMTIPVLIISKIDMNTFMKIVFQISIGGLIYLILTYIYLSFIKKDQTMIKVFLNAIPLINRRK